MNKKIINKKFINKKKIINKKFINKKKLTGREFLKILTKKQILDFLKKYHNKDEIYHMGDVRSKRWREDVLEAREKLKHQRFYFRTLLPDTKYFDVLETNLFMDKNSVEKIKKISLSKLLYNKCLNHNTLFNKFNKRRPSDCVLFRNIAKIAWKAEDKFLESKEEQFIIYTNKDFEENPTIYKRVAKLYTTTFKFKDFMYNFELRNLFAYETNFFYKHRLYFGYQKDITNERNNNYLLGYYLKTAIIDVRSMVTSFKSNLFLINKIIVKKNLNGFLVGETNNDIVEKGVINFINYFEMGYYYGKWWNGFFQNYKIYKNHSSVIYRNYHFYDGLFPGYIFYIGVPGADSTTSLYGLNREMGRLGMPTMMFFDTRHSTEFILSPLLSNNKTYYYFLFYVKIIMCMFIRIMFFKKTTFIKKSMNLNNRYNYFKRKIIPFDKFENDELHNLLTNKKIIDTNFVDSLRNKRIKKFKERPNFIFFYDNFVSLIIKKKKLDLYIAKLNKIN